MKQNDSTPQKGRPNKNKSLQIRVDVFRMLLEKWLYCPGDTLLEHREVENKLSLNIKTVKDIFQDIADISTDIVLGSEGIRTSRQTYYYDNLPIAREFKNAIADEFVKQIPKDVTLACSAGTTVTSCVRRLIEKRDYHVIVTNNIGVINQLSYGDISNLIFTGGEYKPGIHGCVGDTVVGAFADAKCQAALIGVSGINEEGDLFVRHFEEVAVNKQIIRSVTKDIFIVAHADKLSQIDTWRFGNIRELVRDSQKPDLNVCVITNAYELLSEQNRREQAEKVYNSLLKIDDKKVKVIVTGRET